MIGEKSIPTGDQLTEGLGKVAVTHVDIGAAIRKIQEMRPVVDYQGEYIIYCSECKIVDFLSKHVGHLDLNI